MCTSALLKVKSSLHAIASNTHDTLFIKKHLDELKVIIEEIEKDHVYISLNEVLSIIENAVLLSDQKVRNDIIQNQYDEAIRIIYLESYKRINNLQKELEKSNVDDFKIVEFNGYKLTLAGSLDFCYYHEVEIIFNDVCFISCPGSFFYADNFRQATESELIELNKYMNGYEKQGVVVCIENTVLSNKYFIISHEVTYKWEIVYHYNRENLVPGERIADWVNKGIV